MSIQIKQPAALHESGASALNEDFIFPLQNMANREERLFIVCDGEGGPEAGPVAAKLVGLSVAKYFASTTLPEKIDKPFLDGVLSTAEEALSAFKEAHPEKKDISTTLSILHLSDTQATMGWVGNSPTFYFNAAEEKLIAAQSESEVAASIYGADRPAKMNMKFIPAEELHPGDYFFLASDGIQENVDAGTLSTILSSGASAEPEFLLKEIHNLSHGFTKDNYSCYLIQLEKVGEAVAADESSLPATTVSQASAPSASTGFFQDPAHKTTRLLVGGALFLLLGSLIFLAWWANRQTPYEKYMAQAKNYQQQQDYVRAHDQASMAYEYASGESEKDSAHFLRSEILRLWYLNAGVNPEETPADELSMSAEEYLAQGNAAMQALRFPEALRFYANAQRMKQVTQNEEVNIPLDSIARAHLEIANQLYDQQNRDCASAIAHFNAASAIYKEANISTENSLYQQVKTRNDWCSGNLQLASRTRSLEGLLPQAAAGAAANAEDQATAASLNDLAQAENGAASQGSSSTSGNAQRQPSRTRSIGTTPAPAGANARKSSPNPAGSQTSSTSSRGTAESTATAEQRKALYAGKRLYSEASGKQSDYLFRQSALQLEQAAPALDGSGAYLLAYLYHMGKGVDKDPAKALMYAQKSALKGWAAGHYLYAHQLLIRENRRDTITAKVSLRKAAEKNYLDAIKLLQELGETF